jgi:hypothetical protein
MGMRGCRAGSPTRLHKEGNALHTVQGSATYPQPPLVMHHQRQPGGRIWDQFLIVSDAFSGRIFTQFRAPGLCGGTGVLSGEPAGSEDCAVRSSPASIPTTRIEVSIADLPSEGEETLELGAHGVVLPLQQWNQLVAVGPSGGGGLLGQPLTDSDGICRKERASAPGRTIK